MSTIDAESDENTPTSTGYICSLWELQKQNSVQKPNKQKRPNIPIPEWYTKIK